MDNSTVISVFLEFLKRQEELGAFERGLRRATIESGERWRGLAAGLREILDCDHPRNIFHHLDRDGFRFHEESHLGWVHICDSAGL